jgi:glycine dehydrogenase subunit 2
MLTNNISKKYLRSEIASLPELSEREITRHFTNLASKNFSVDAGFYPLGSCTMKYNPKVNEAIASWNNFTEIHPHSESDFCQGSLEILYKSQEFFKEITGMDAFTLLPLAGAHGELIGMLIAREYFKKKGGNRKYVIVPNTAHGTNPASANLAGFEIKEVKCNGGSLNEKEIAAIISEDTACVMITNPNTLGLFEKDIIKISKIVHDHGALVYMDGANFNALIGSIDVSKMGTDILHLNLHKTFSTPHGGGGPGSGPIGVRSNLASFLPVPCVEYTEGKYKLNYNLKNSIGKLTTFYGNFSVILKSYIYILSLGRENLKNISKFAVLNANYIKESLKEYYHLPYDETCMHECVFSDKFQKDFGVTTLDIAKRLMDYGFHPPTIYFPLVVHGALMIEPTETESKQTLDEFIDAMKKIANEARENKDILKNAPQNTPVRRVDEVYAARNLKLRY